jgi:hypothetical protein
MAREGAEVLRLGKVHESGAPHAGVQNVVGGHEGEAGLVAVGASDPKWSSGGSGSSPDS